MLVKNGIRELKNFDSELYKNIENNNKKGRSSLGKVWYWNCFQKYYKCLNNRDKNEFVQILWNKFNSMETLPRINVKDKIWITRKNRYTITTSNYLVINE